MSRRPARARLPRTLGVLGLAPLLVLVACASGEQATTPGGEQDPGTEVPAPVELDQAGAVEDHLRAVSDLGADLVAEAGQDTLVVSPAGLATTLAMLGAGAGGTTRSEIEDLLGADVDAALEAIQALRAARSELDQDPATIELDPLPDHAILHLANQVVLAEGAEPERAWSDTVTGRLGTGVVTAGEDELQQVLDDWVNLHTAGLVEESGISADQDTLLVVQDALLVASAWLTGFDGSLTTQEDFTLPGGDVVQVPTMHAERPQAYAEVDGHQVVALDLLDGLHLEVLLPAEGTAPTQVTAEQWASVSDALAEGGSPIVELALPRADVETSLDLMPLLGTLGAADLVGGSPDLSGVLEEDLVLDQAVQQARLQVGEEGVVAAAVTEVGGTGSAQPPPERVEMTVDRPYALRIVDQDGWVLLHGAIGDPRG